MSNYIKKQEDFEKKKLYMSDDEIEQLTIAMELQRQLDADALIAERIVTHALAPAAVEPVKTETAREEDISGLSPLTQEGSNLPLKEEKVRQVEVFLVKWTSCEHRQTYTHTDIHTHNYIHTYTHTYIHTHNYSSVHTHTQTHEAVTFCYFFTGAYDQCTWETAEFLNEHSFAHLIVQYRERERRLHGDFSGDLPLNQHDLSETSFEPYAKTPSFLGSQQKPLELRDYQLTGNRCVCESVCWCVSLWVCIVSF